MGKKRRLNSAKLKFSAKYANHPRMKILLEKEETSATQDLTLEAETPTQVEEAKPEAKPILAEHKTSTTTKPALSKQSKTKKTTTTKRKRTTKKKTTSAMA